MTQVFLILGIVLAAATFGVGLWTAIVLGLRSAAGLEKTPPPDIGPPWRESGIGTAKVNGINYKNCVHIVEHDAGWLLVTPWIFGGGVLWLPRDATTIGPVERARLFRFLTSRRLTCGPHVVTLYGKLTDFVSDDTGFQN